MSPLKMSHGMPIGGMHYHKNTQEGQSMAAMNSDFLEELAFMIPLNNK